MSLAGGAALLQLVAWAIAALAVLSLAWRSRGPARWGSQLLLTWCVAEVAIAGLLWSGWRPGGTDEGPLPRTWDGGWTGPVGRRTMLSYMAVPASADAILPPSDAVRVAFIGDSFTSGEGVELANRFTSLVVDRLEERGRAIDPMVYGVPGMGFPDAAALYLEAVAPRQPDVVVLVLIPNDFRGVDPAAADIVGDFVQVPMPEQLAPSAVLSLLDRPRRVRDQSRAVSASYAQAMVSRENLERVDALVRAMTEETSSRGAALLIVMFPFMHQLDHYPLADPQRRVLRRAELAGADVLDLLPAFEGRDARRLWVASADHHPNAEGHRIAADAMLDAVASRLRKAGPRRCPTPAALYDEEVRGAALRDALCADPLAADAWLNLARHWRDTEDVMELGLWGGRQIAEYLAATAEVLAFDGGDEDMAREASEMITTCCPD